MIRSRTRATTWSCRLGRAIGDGPSPGGRSSCSARLAWAASDVQCCIQYTHGAIAGILAALSLGDASVADAARTAWRSRTNARRRRAAGGLPFPIVDAHQHFWDPERNYYPWLNDEPPIPFRYGDYRAIRRRYLPPDYRADARAVRASRSRCTSRPSGIRATRSARCDYIESLRREHGLPSVAVAQAWLDRDDAPHVLERHARVPVRAQRPAQAARERVARATPRPAA